MSTINFAQITFQGRLTDDPEVRSLDNGNTICKFTVAVNRRIPGGDEKTSFIPTTVFGKNAVNCGQYLSKGRVVLVTGEFETDKYEDRNGVKRTGFGCLARDVIFGSGGSDREAPETEESVDFDSLPEEVKKQATRNYIRGGRGR